MRKSLLAATSLGSVAIAPFVPGYSCPAGAEEFNWSGYYFGVNLGDGLRDGKAKLNLPDGGSYGLNFQSGAPTYGSGIPFSGVSNAATFAAWPSRHDTGSSFLAGGIGGGYNCQSGQIVAGLEADASLLGFFHAAPAWTATDSFTGGTSGAGTRVSPVNLSSTVNQLYTLRPRMGVAINKLLLFGTGGLAVGDVSLKTSAAIDEQYADTGKGGISYTAGSRWSGSQSGLRAGFVAGGGAEYAFDEHLSFKAEWLYFNLGTAKVTAQGAGTYTYNGGAATPLTVEPYSAQMLIDGSIVRTGINWRF